MEREHTIDHRHFTCKLQVMRSAGESVGRWGHANIKNIIKGGRGVMMRICMWVWGFLFKARLPSNYERKRMAKPIVLRVKSYGPKASKAVTRDQISPNGPCPVASTTLLPSSFFSLNPALFQSFISSFTLKIQISCCASLKISGKDVCPDLG